MWRHHAQFRICYQSVWTMRQCCLLLCGPASRLPRGALPQRIVTHFRAALSPSQVLTSAACWVQPALPFEMQPPATADGDAAAGAAGVRLDATRDPRRESGGAHGEWRAGRPPLPASALRLTPHGDPPEWSAPPATVALRPFLVSGFLASLGTSGWAGGCTVFAPMPHRCRTM